MALCGKCGAQMANDAASCSQCGNPAGGANPSESARGESGMEENVAGALSYAGIWVTGLIFFLIDKRPSVRFHAAQSMVVFGGLHILYIILGYAFFGGSRLGGYGFFSLGSLLFNALWLVGFVLWIVLMIKTYQNEKFKVPVAAGIAESLARK